MGVQGAFVNVLQRNDSLMPEDPWVGCRGNHLEHNYAHMLYGEASSGLYLGLLHSLGEGLSVFIR